jgi:hypothetical protein
MAQDYRTGRLLARITSGIGWVIIVIGAVMFILGFARAILGIGGAPGFAAVDAPVNIALMSVVSGLSLVISGVVLVAMGQAARAVMDNANYTRQLLDYIRNN